MQSTTEITTQLTSPNIFERLAGMRFVYSTTISDELREVVGRGPTPEASHEAAAPRFCAIAAAMLIGERSHAENNHAVIDAGVTVSLR